MIGPSARDGRTVLFFAIACLFSWAAWITLFLQHLPHLTGPGLWIYLLAVLAPHGSAAAVTAMEGGLVGVRDYYRLVFRRVRLRWVGAAIVIPPLVFLTRDALVLALHLPHDSFFHQPTRTLAILILGQLAVALGEEPGWRGFALPRLIGRFGPTTGTLVLGIGWALWHLPLFLVAGTAQYGTPFIPFMVTLMAWSMVMTFLVLRAGGSTIVAMLFHASANLCDYTMWGPQSQLLDLGPWVAVALLACWNVRVAKWPAAH